MAVFSVSYDLNKSGQNYEAIWAELKNSSSWYRIMDSTWLISTSETADQLATRVNKHVDRNDRVLVSKLNAGQYSGWLTDEQWQWIRERL